MSKQFNEKQYTPEGLLAGLESVNFPSSKIGNVYRYTTSELEDLFCDIIENQLKIPEIEHCMIWPHVDRDDNIVGVPCVAYFNTNAQGATNIVRAGKQFSKNPGRNNEQRQVLLPAGIGNGGGRTSGLFTTSDNFKSGMKSICVPDNDGNLRVNALPSNKNIAMVEIDFNAMLSVILNVEPDSPYDLSIIGVQPTFGQNNRKDYRSSILLIAKFIDNSNKKRKKNRNSVNYDEFDRMYMDKYNGNGSGGQRRF